MGRDDYDCRFYYDLDFIDRCPAPGPGRRGALVVTVRPAAHPSCHRGGGDLVSPRLLALNQILLLFIHRVRPYDGGITHLLIAPSADFSFPSDHATASFAIAAAFLLHDLRRRGLIFLAAALLVAFSRVYIGTHYASDVLGGALTGIVAAALVRSAYWEDTRADRIITGIL